MNRIHFTLFMVSGLMSLMGCRQSTPSDRLINWPASLLTSLELSDNPQHVISSVINQQQQTISVLYGSGGASSGPTLATNWHQEWKTLTLVTWLQQDDPHWFGARIPGELESVEQLHRLGKPGDNTLRYQKLLGRNLRETTDTTGRAARIRFIQSIRPSLAP